MPPKITSPTSRSASPRPSYHVYVIQSETCQSYIGQTENLEKRLQQHNLGKSGYTRRGKNWRLVYSEKFSTRKKAMLREAELKTSKGRKFVHSLLEKQK
jgi:putative endonuclease